MSPEARAYLKGLRAAVRERAREIPKLPFVPFEEHLRRHCQRSFLAADAWDHHALWFGTGRSAPLGILDGKKLVR